jgi:hypothetical protein
LDAPLQAETILPPSRSQSLSPNSRDGDVYFILEADAVIEPE